ncbi:Tectonin beta-propeller repeat-containing protein 1 [Halotydeus destructor]|nr:Tectonin beta-propeller repeat-containing protein 1 [Halotydeus destructor]
MAGVGHLWTIDSSGGIKFFNVKDNSWTALEYERIEFKRVSASPWCAWAIGGDLQVYLYILSRDIPIRQTVVTYENQRWVPIKGFGGANRLPTDRPYWSNKDGTQAKPKESFVLPSRSWAWEGAWFLEDNLDSEPLAPDCWTYAIDFPMEYGPERNWNSLARRRKWIRHMRYVAVNRWVQIDGLHDDTVTEPFIDIACGGYDLPGKDGRLCVWAVTILSHVIVRENVDIANPEGTGWLTIDTSEEKVNQISVGPTGLVWTVTWEGKALVRGGVTRDNIYGSHWIEVEPPVSAKLLQVSVGIDAVWAISRDYRVWFRKGVRAKTCGMNDSCAMGSGWIEMVGEMSVISVSGNDQVYAIDAEKKELLFRTDISSGEYTGRSWKLISGPSRAEEKRPLNHILLASHSDTESLSSVDSVSTSVDSYATASNDEINWTWLSASAVNLNGDFYMSGMISSLTENLSVSSTENWKGTIKRKLKERSENEVKPYLEQFPFAIEKGTWIKSGQAFKLSKNHDNIILCQLELEKHGAEKGTESGTLICSYSPSQGKPVEKLVVNLASIACIQIRLNRVHKNYANIMTIYLNEGKKISEKFSILFKSEKELNDWFTTLNVAASNIQDYESSLIASPLFWCVSDHGSVYSCHLHEQGYFFRHVGDGHFSAVETCTAGVTWAIADGKLYSYTNGSGGGIYQSISGASSNTYPVECARTFKVYENQRWNPITGFAARGLPTDRPMWSDKSGKTELQKDDVRLPSSSWQWTSDWLIDYTTSGGVDESGWQYAVDFPFEYHPEKSFTDYARRRRWHRKCKLTTSGPWLPIESPPLLVVSLCSLDDERDDVLGWAVTEKGEALCRSGISETAVQGSSWIHVACNQKLIHISAGGNKDHIKVWAVAADGTLCMRNGISPSKPEGTSWFYVEPPKNKKNYCPVMQVSIGSKSIFALDDRFRLWIRENVMAAFPEGTKWRHVCDNIRQASVNHHDQFLVTLANKDKTCLNNELVLRQGVTHETPLGDEWLHLGICIFNHVSFAGNFNTIRL